MARIFPLLVLALTLTACAGKGPSAGPVPATPSAAIALGSNSIGEQCRALPADSADGGKAYAVYCGAWEQPSGGISVTELYDPLPEGADAAARQLAVEASRTGWSGALAQKANCQPAQSVTGPQGEKGLLASCQLREGGWPYIGITLVKGRQMLQGDGIPAIADLLLNAPALLAAGPSAQAPAQADLAPTLRAALGDAALRFGRGDLNAFERLSEVGRLSNSVEDYAGAEAAYRQALDIQTRALGPDSPGVGDTLMALALEVSNQGRGPEAEALFRRADSLQQKSFDKAARARLASYMAFHAANTGDPRRALSLGREASAVRRAIVDDLEEAAGAGANRAVLGSLAAARGDLIHSLLLEATVSLRLEQYGLAAAAAQEASALFERTRGLPPWWHARILGIIGLAKAGGSDVAGGAALMSKAVGSNRQLFGAGWPVASSMLELGRVYAQGGLDDQAIAIYREGLSMIQAAENAPSLLPLDRIAPYLDVLYRRSQQDAGQRAVLQAEMFRALQMVREGVVGQTITRAAARFASDDPAVADLIRRQQDAVRERDRLRMEAAAETAKPDIQRDRDREARLTRQLTEVTATAQGLERQVQAAFPAYARLTRPRPVEAADLSARLAPDEALVQFAITSRQSYGFILRKSGITAYPVTVGRGQLTDMVTELRRSITPRAGVLPAFDLALSHDLYRRLFAGGTAALADARHLVIVPSGALSSLPPALLVTDDPGASRDYARAAFLVREKSVSVAPSIPAFMALSAENRRPAAPRPFIGFAAPPFEGKGGGGMAALAEECRTDAVLDPALLRGLAPLPETAGEIREVGQRLGAAPADLITGAGVTKQAVRAAGLDQYRILYFATHGLLPGELRCQSQPGLALAPPPARPATAADDGLLTASDIALLRLNADLVVLSACNTAGGDAKLGGEALSGLAESFFFAGARALIVSHWQVPSAPTVRLMTSLFAQSAAAPAEALAAAQRRLASDPATAHPFNWAAFTLVGAPTPSGNGA